MSDRARRASGQNFENDPTESTAAITAASDSDGFRYAVRYDDHLVTDPSWTSIADVIATYHGGFTDEQGRVTGVLLRRVGDDWEEVA